MEQVRLYAHEDAEKLRTQLNQRGNMTHFFSRLDRILSNVDRKNLFDNFKTQLENEIRDGSSFEGHLKNLSMANGQKFYDVFTGQAKFPRDIQTLLEDSEQVKKIRGEIDLTEKDFSADEFFYEYLTNYFRFARKIAADEGRRDA